jgi:hypothetical protein
MNSVARHLLEGYNSLEYILLGDLRDLLEEPLDAQNMRWLAAVLDVLLENIPRQFDLVDDEQGYLHEVIEAQPNWSNEVERLRSEYLQIFRRLHELRQHLENPAHVAAHTRELRHNLRDWMETFCSLRRHETRLVQTALNLEIGGGD